MISQQERRSIELATLITSNVVLSISQIQDMVDMVVVMKLHFLLHVASLQTILRAYVKS